MTAGYWFTLTCPVCGGPVDHVADGRPIAGTEASAVCRCTSCRHHWHLLVTARPRDPTRIRRPTGQEKEATA